MTTITTDLMPAARGGLMLSVLGGLHRGVAMPIAGDSCMIGSASNCDVVLGDRRIAPDHLRLRFYGRQVAVDALGGPVEIEGQPPVERGHGRRMALPVTLALGEARLLIDRTMPNAASGRRAIVIVAAIFVAILVALLATQSSGFGVAMDRAAPAEQAPLPAAAPPNTDAADALRSRIAEAGLDGLIVGGSGPHVTVSGSVPDASRADWTEVQRWFDGNYGGSHVLSGTVVTAAPAQPPSFSFQAVWFGANPYVVDARGERRYPGASLQGGWMLKSIASGAITVTRNGTEFQLTL